MGKVERGTKRQCQECDVKFYDLNKDPIICPKCGEKFTVVSDAPAPKPVKAKVADKVKDEGELSSDSDAPEIISLDDAEEEENAGEEIPDVDDVEVDDSVNADQQDTFLEEDDEDAKIDLGVSTDTGDET